MKKETYISFISDRMSEFDKNIYVVLSSYFGSAFMSYMFIPLSPQSTDKIKESYIFLCISSICVLFCSYKLFNFRIFSKNIYKRQQENNWFINNNCGKCLTKTPISGRIRNRNHPVTYYEMFTVFGYCQIKQIKYNTETQKGINLFSEGLLTALINADNGEEYKDEKITTETEIIWRGFLTRKGFLQAMRAFWKKYDGAVW